MSTEVRTCEFNPDVSVVMLAGRLDAKASEAVSAALLDALERSPAGLILDIGAVSFVSSAGLRAVIGVHKRAHASGKAVALIKAQPAVYKIFKVSGLDAAMRFFEEEAEAAETLWPPEG